MVNMDCRIGKVIHWDPATSGVGVHPSTDTFPGTMSRMSIPFMLRSQMIIQKS